MNFSINYNSFQNVKIDFLEKIKPFKKITAIALLTLGILAVIRYAACYHNSPVKHPKNSTSKNPSAPYLDRLDNETKKFFKTIMEPVHANSSEWPTIIHGANACQETKNYLENHTELVKQFYETNLSVKKNDKLSFMGMVRHIPAGFGLWMPGIALAIAYLKNKYRLEAEFYSCNTLEGFSKKLEQFLDSDKRRCVFIVPCNDSGLTAPNFPQHKIAVVVEKHHTGRIKLALLESQPYINKVLSPISPENINNYSNIWVGNELQGSFSAPELVSRAVLQAKLPLNVAVDLYYSVVYRLTSYGCESFSIQDGLAFLRDPKFFDNINTKETHKKLNDLPLHEITQLPPAFMIGTQSLKKFNEYHQKNGDLLVKTKEGKSITLSAYAKKYMINNQNHYITVKSARYNEIVLQMLMKMSLEAINHCLSETYVE